MKRILFLLIFVIFSIAPGAFAQFEGEILFQLQQMENGRTDVSEFKITVADDRIYISSERDLNILSGVKSDGLLVRNDLGDFVFNTGENEALKVTKKDLDSLMDMIERFGGASSKEEKDQFDWENRLEETGNKQTHLGYDVEEFRLKGDHPDQYVSVWLTSDIKVLWGMVIEVWQRAGDRFSDSELPLELILNSNSFPLLIEVFDRGEQVVTFTSVNVETDQFDRSVIELSEDKRLVGLTEMMMNMFRQQ